MIDPAWGPFLFDTSAEGWLARNDKAEVRAWLASYLSRHPPHVSAVTVIERIRGYSLLAGRAQGEKQQAIKEARAAYLESLGHVWPLDGGSGLVAGEIMALLPDPPSPPRRSHQLVESRQERLSRWRFDQMIAATALVSGLRLMHNNAIDFEAIRDAVKLHPRPFQGLGPLQLIHCGSLT